MCTEQAAATGFIGQAEVVSFRRNPRRYASQRVDRKYHDDRWRPERVRCAGKARSLRRERNRFGVENVSACTLDYFGGLINP
jgi:hypothetical protein